MTSPVSVARAAAAVAHEPDARRAAAEALALRGRVQRGADGVRGARAASARRGSPSGRCTAASRTSCASARACCRARAGCDCTRRMRREDGAARAGRLRIRDGGVALDLSSRRKTAFARTARTGAAGVDAQAGGHRRARHARARRRAPPSEVRARAVIDDTAGYHARRTEWWWSAGVGQSADGRALAWNLVSGVNDPPSGSERAVWVDGEPREAPPVRFGADLRRIVRRGRQRAALPRRGRAQPQREPDRHQK